MASAASVDDGLRTVADGPDLGSRVVRVPLEKMVLGFANAWGGAGESRKGPLLNSSSIVSGAQVCACVRVCMRLFSHLSARRRERAQEEEGSPTYRNPIVR